MRTGLAVAVRHNHSEMIDLLLERNSFVDAVDLFGNSVFFYAIDSGSQELVFVSLTEAVKAQLLSIHESTKDVSKRSDWNSNVFEMR